MAPPLPPRCIPKPLLPADKDDDLSSEASDDAGHDDLLEKIIRDGIQKVTTEPTSALPKHIFKENPVRMFRKGGNQIMETVSDETSHFNVEDSPCSFSVMSALSDLTVNSHREQLDRDIHQPRQFVSNHNEPPSVDNHSLSSLSIESEDDGNLLNRVSEHVVINQIIFNVTEYFNRLLPLELKQRSSLHKTQIFFIKIILRRSLRYQTPELCRMVHKHLLRMILSHHTSVQMTH